MQDARNAGLISERSDLTWAVRVELLCITPPRILCRTHPEKPLKTPSVAEPLGMASSGGVCGKPGVSITSRVLVLTSWHL
jgi:hypothetical protein